MVDDDFFRDDIIKTREVELDDILADKKDIKTIAFNQVRRSMLQLICCRSLNQVKRPYNFRGYLFCKKMNHNRSQCSFFKASMDLSFQCTNAIYFG